MAFIKLGTEATKGVGEAQNVPDGRYNLRIASKEFDEEKRMYVLDIVVENPPADIQEVFPLRHWINLPVGNDVDKDKNKWRFTRRFLFLFGIPYSEDGFDDDNLVGATAEQALLQTEPYTDKAGVKKNAQRIETPPVPREAQASFEGRGRGAARRVGSGRR